MLFVPLIFISLITPIFHSQIDGNPTAINIIIREICGYFVFFTKVNHTYFGNAGVDPSAL